MPSLRSPAGAPSAPDRPTWATGASHRRHELGLTERTAAALGLELMPWQRRVVRVATELLGTGYAFPLVVVTVPRQAGKTTLVGLLALGRMLERPGTRVWLTAQTRQDARDTLLELGGLLAGSALGPVTHQRLAAGSEQLSLPGGSSMRVFSPGPHALHGRVADLVVLDEVWAYDEDRGAQVLQAAVPAQATRPRRQVLAVSTAGDDAATFLAALVEAGRAGVGAGLRQGAAYFEWSVPDELDAGDPAVAARYHPAVGHTITPAALVDAARVMARHPGAFARAYGNRWTTGTGDPALDPEHYRATVRVDLAPGSPLVLGYDVALDRQHAAVAVAGRSGDLPVVELIAYDRGSAWLPGRLAELAVRHQVVAIAHDPAGPGAGTAERITLPAGCALLPARSRDYAAASEGFAEAVDAGLVAIRPSSDLDVAVLGAGRRLVGDGWAFGRRASSADVSPLIAAALALWGLDRVPATPPAPHLYVRDEDLETAAG